MDQATTVEVEKVERKAEEKKENPMRRIRIEKVVINSCIGANTPRLERAAKIIEMLTGQKPEFRKAKKTIKGFGIYRGQPIAVRVTLRKQKAVEFLEKALKAVNNTLKASSFDENGNFSFGIKEHLDIPGTKYDPELGIIGMDVCVHLSRPGLRVALRKRARSKIGPSHKITREEAMEFVKNTFGVRIIEEE
ncbi:MAG: 50S ribosomal protein L5 [Thaumarchaeota archaeon]|nr:MAG: 50S ribosomal protein L5 [Nitrososphaerota archaeon]